MSEYNHLIDTNKLPSMKEIVSRMSMEDVNSLGEGCWLTDMAILFGFSMIQHEILHDLDMIYFMEPSVVNMVLRSKGKSLVIVFVKSAQYYYLDSSFTRKNFKDAGVFCERLHSALHPQMRNTKHNLSVLSVPSQTNNNDCGVYLLFYAQIVATNLKRMYGHAVGSGFTPFGVANVINQRVRDIMTIKPIPNGSKYREKLNSRIMACISL
ncbi:hypothetical protein EV182_001870 [Spiromyces aspiralis]|uniref:Uncharacterized protein n=1 Tax=Spiromyces aspiralis TaxID=68401 RepID=A0ACC1HW18_9FUNG|nr:hypothetical protein EV182_001870 [Spiromyces aspiralis]